MARRIETRPSILPSRNRNCICLASTFHHRLSPHFKASKFCLISLTPESSYGPGAIFVVGMNSVRRYEIEVASLCHGDVVCQQGIIAIILLYLADMFGGSKSCFINLVLK